jgi:hypothetical protein
VRSAVRAAQFALAIVLVAVWWLHAIHAPISEYVGAHFPFPSRASALVWPAVLTQTALIEALVCLPVAALLALIFRSEATPMAVGLVCTFALRVAVEVFDRDEGRRMQILGLCQIGAQALLLVGGAICFRKLLPRWKVARGL